MLKLMLCILALILLGVPILGQNTEQPSGSLEWQRTFGGSQGDSAHSVQRTSDGGYIVAGWTSAYGAEDYDAWLIKTDSNGTELWNRTFGGSQGDSAHSVQQTSDGGYIACGATSAYGAEDYDAWLIKTDSNGTELWNRTFGRSADDDAYSVQQTSEGGYIVAGWTRGLPVPCNWLRMYCNDVWLIKTDSNGTELWNRTFGESSSDERAYSVQQTSDGGYIIGSTHSHGFDEVAWLIKTDSNGNELWNRTFGERWGERWSSTYSVQPTSDGGYIIAGDTVSYGPENADVLLIKTDSNGTELWNRTFGRSADNLGYSVQQTSDRGYIVAGDTGGFEDYDVWLIKTDSNGNELWNRTFGGSDLDLAWLVRQTSEGGYIVAGWASSYGAGGYDAWLIKTDSNGTELWNRTFGGSADDYAYSVQQTSDGGYIACGATPSHGVGDYDAWLIKTGALEEPSSENASIEEMRIRKLQDEKEHELLSIGEDVTGVGVGLDKFDKPVLTVYVKKKSRSLVKKIQAVLEGEPFIIEESGEIIAQ